MTREELNEKTDPNGWPIYVSPTPVPLATRYPDISGSVTWEKEAVDENGDVFSEKRYSDGTIEKEYHDGREKWTCLIFPDGTEVICTDITDYTEVDYPDGSVRLFWNDGKTTVFSPDGELDYTVVKKEEKRFNMVLFFRFKESEKDAVICNSDGSLNKWSDRHLNLKSLSFGGGSFGMNIIGTDGTRLHYEAKDGPFYDR